ncbi:MAG: hypothetical protein ACREYF_28105 [Gammaproteobacteria bacterium]
MTRKKATKPETNALPPTDTVGEAPPALPEAAAGNKPVVSKERRAAPPKYQLAEALYRDNPGLRRKEYIKLFVEQAGMAPHYAAGFLYHLKRYGAPPEKPKS